MYVYMCVHIRYVCTYVSTLNEYVCAYYILRQHCSSVNVIDIARVTSRSMDRSIFLPNSEIQCVCVYGCGKVRRISYVFLSSCGCAT